jgi:hypothetical protein
VRRVNPFDSAQAFGFGRSTGLNGEH